MPPIRFTSLVAALLAVGALPVHGQTFPSKTITVVVPVIAGGVTDQMGRAFAAEMAKNIGRPVIVENRPGVNGIAGANAVAKAAPDGHTLCFCYSGPVALAKVSAENLPYDIDKDFLPVSRVYELTPVISVPANSKFNTLGEMIAAAKAQPGKLAYGHTGIGGALHLGFEQLKSIGGFDILAVSYNGENPIVPDLITGRLDMALLSPLFAKAQADGGKVKLLAQSGNGRLALLPNVPSVAESGYPAYRAGTWSGFFLPAGTPAPVVERLYESIQAAAKEKSVQDRLSIAGLTPVVGNTPAEFRDFVEREKQSWTELVKQLGGLPK